jgi:two-component system KDP operon response regulator KdpE
MASPRRNDMARKKILVVDDDQDQLRGLSVRLKANGYSVFSAADAVLAISLAREKEPDLVLLDIGLPGGDGFLVMERLRDLMPVAIPIVIFTARDPLINRERALNAGAVAFLQKPVDNDELLAVIRKALAEPEDVPEKM